VRVTGVGLAVGVGVVVAPADAFDPAVCEALAAGVGEA